MICYNASSEVIMIILCGLKGCGKTTLGSAAASHLGLSFIDLDALLGQNPRDLYRQSPQLFAQAEYKALLSIDLERDGMLALGGGTLENDSCRTYLKGRKTIYLMQDEDVLFERMRSTGWPAWLEGEADKRLAYHKVYEKRNKTCLSFCQYRLKLNDCTDRDLQGLVRLLGGII
jgi:shikimate kinase